MPLASVTNRPRHSPEHQFDKTKAQRAVYGTVVALSLGLIGGLSFDMSYVLSWGLYGVLLIGLREGLSEGLRDALSEGLSKWLFFGLIGVVLDPAPERKILFFREPTTNETRSCQICKGIFASRAFIKQGPVISRPYWGASYSYAERRNHRCLGWGWKVYARQPLASTDGS